MINKLYNSKYYNHKTSLETLLTKSRIKNCLWICTATFECVEWVNVEQKKVSGLGDISENHYLMNQKRFGNNK